MPRAVFGVSLEESLDVAEIASLPAIVFRCIQYLEAKKADQEEGIYRLSGSSAVIKALKDRFNNGEYRIHAANIRMQLMPSFPQRVTSIFWVRTSTGTLTPSLAF